MGTLAPTVHVISSMIFIGGVNHIKNKLDWFDENWKLDVKLHTAILDLLLTPYIQNSKTGEAGICIQRKSGISKVSTVSNNAET